MPQTSHAAVRLASSSASRVSKRAIVSAVMLAALMSSTASFAQTARNSDATLPIVEVTGDGRSDSLKPLGGQLPEPKIPRQITQSISVVERAQIEQTSPTGLLDLLATVPGVSIARAGGIGGQIYLRGFSSNSFRSPLFVDGDRFRGRNTLQLNYFSPEEIERVEVIRGPASVMYGSEALTGLVNIVTRAPPSVDPNGPFRFTGGGWSAGFGTAAKSFSTNDWISGAGAGFDFLANISGRWGNDYRTGTGTAPNSDYRSIGGSLKLGYTPTIGQRLELTLRDYSEVDGRAGGVGGAPGAPFNIVRQDPNQVKTARLAYTGEFDGLIKHVEASVYANYFETYLATAKNTVSGSGVVTPSSYQISHVIGPLMLGGRFLAVIPWSAGFGESKTSFGMDGFKEARPGSETSTSLGPYIKAGPDTTQSNVGAFVLHEWTPVQQLTLSAGGRFDWFNTTTELSPISPAVLPAFIGKENTDSTAPTGSIGAVYRVLPNLDLLASLATSFRQPTNSELFNSSPAIIPNPDLQPEKGVTYEGGFRFHIPSASVKVTAFNSRYENFLQTVAVPFLGGSKMQAQNIGQAEVNGIELEERWQATSTVNIFATAAYLHGTNTLTGTPLPWLAPFRGRLGVQYVQPDESFSILGVVDWASRKNRIDPGAEVETAGYAIPKIYATLQLGKLVSPQLGDTKLVLGVENIFDKAYVDASTFMDKTFAQSLTNPLLEVGRNFTVKVQHTF